MRARSPTPNRFRPSREVALGWLHARSRHAAPTFLGRAARAAPRPNDRRGHVQDVLPELQPHPEHDIAYLCGNPDMIDANFTLLKELGLPIKHIRREKYVSSR